MYNDSEPSSNSDEGSQYRHMRAARLVLSELHRAQRVVNKLSPKLNPCPDRVRQAMFIRDRSEAQTLNPFSVGTLER